MATVSYISDDFVNVIRACNAEKIPARLKLQKDGCIIFELGFNYPDELADDIYNIMHTPTLSHIQYTVCAEQHGGDIIQVLFSGGGPKQYKK